MEFKQTFVILLAVLLIGGGIYFLITPSEKHMTSDEILKNFEKGVALYSEPLLRDFDGVVYSDKFYLLNLPVKNIELRDSNTDEGKFLYLIYLHDMDYEQYLKEYDSNINCSDYSGSPKMECQFTKVVAGDLDAETVWEQLKGLKFSTYRDVRNLRIFCDVFHSSLANPDACNLIACSKIYDIGKPPTTICEKRYYSELALICLNDSSGFQELSESDLLTIDDLACYNAAYSIYNRSVNGVII